MAQTQKKTTPRKRQEHQAPRRPSGPHLQKKSVRKGPTIRRRKRNQALLLLGVLALIGAILLGFVLIARWQITQQQSTATANQPAQLLDPIVLQEVVNVSQSTWETIGTGNVKNPVKLLKGAAPLQGQHGLPELFYLSGEFCPNCAAERWSLLNALSRFGTFEQVRQIQSSEAQISTVSFYNASYNSPYLDFVPLETRGNTVDSSGRYVVLQSMTPAQQELVDTYDSTGGIPFIDIGNRFLLQGASFAYTTLEDGMGNPLSWQQIASSLGDPRSPIAQNILGTANYLTAALCVVTGQQPENVCKASAIQRIEHSLGATDSINRAGPLSWPGVPTRWGIAPGAKRQWECLS